MTRIRVSKSLTLLCCALVCALAAKRAAADALPINSGLSVLNIGVTIGLNDPDAGFIPLASAVGQGGVLPAGPFTGGVIPGFSNGLSAQVTGTMQVTSGGGIITIGPGSSIGLLSSGDWQPGTAPDGTGSPLPAEIGGYILASFLGVDDLTAILTLNNSQFDITAGGVLDGGGNFTDPAGVFNIINTDLAGRVVDALAAIDSTFAQPSGPQSTVASMSGNYFAGILTLPVSAGVTIDLGDLAPGVVALVSIDGTIVAGPVPEPGTITLMGLGLVGLGYAGYRRRVRK